MGLPQLPGRLPAPPQAPQAEKGLSSGQEAPRALPALLPDGPPAGDPQAAAARLRTALLCRERLGLSWEAAARLLGTSPARCQRLYGAALKAGRRSPRPRPRPTWRPSPPARTPFAAAWEEFLSQRGQAGFAARQRYRRARRAMDAAMPFLALGVVAICVVAFLGVEHGWFGPSSVPGAGHSPGELQR